MIFPPPLVKVHILGKNNAKKEIIQKLHTAGLVHITPAPIEKQLRRDTSMPGVEVISNALLKLKYIATQTNTKIDKEIHALDEPHSAIRDANTFIKKYFPEIERLTKERETLERKRKQLLSRIKVVQEIPHIQKKAQKTTVLYVSKKPISVSMKKAKVETIKKNNMYYVRVELPPEYEEALDNAIRDSPLRKIAIDYITDNNTQTIKDFKTEESNIQKQIIQTLQQQQDLISPQRSKLKHLITTLENHYDIYTITNSCSRTNNLFLLTGYCEEKDVQTLAQTIPDITITVERAQEDAPTKLENNAFTNKFQPITELFSTPKYNSVDPTFTVSLFFPLFFGIMLGDIGYALLILLTLIPLKIYGVARETRRIILYSGLSAGLFGWVFGSFFGNLIPIKPLYMNSFDATISLLIISLAIGLIHINIALVLQILQGIRKKQVGAYVRKTLPIYTIQLMGGAYALGELAIGHFLLAATIGILIYNQGIFGIMNITGYVGTWFSYARILALSLATAGVALAVNTLAQKAGIFMALVLIIGHLFNLIVSTIGCGINAARLHYVEFFTLFFEGGGEPFKPFKRKNYVEVKQLWSTSPADSSQ